MVILMLIEKVFELLPLHAVVLSKTLVLGIVEDDDAVRDIVLPFSICGDCATRYTTRVQREVLLRCRCRFVLIEHRCRFAAFRRLDDLELVRRVVP